MLRRLPLFALLLLPGSVAYAEEASPPGLEPLPEPPAMEQEPSAEDEAAVEPQVTITQRGEETVEEYRVNGQLYMIKVTPAKGPSYYLVDGDGDGNLETRRSDLDPKFLVPSWMILRW